MKQHSTYLMGGDSPAEMARLIEQDLYMTHIFGLFPAYLSQEQIAAFKHVLDIGCGPGDLALKWAKEYPDLDITGIDVSEPFIRYARAQAQSRELNNLTFKHMNALIRLEFAENTFDYLNIRLSLAWVPAKLYPKLLKDCLRVLRPGGILTISESELGTTDAPANQEIFRWISRLLYKNGLGFGLPDQICITPVLARLLREAGFSNLQRQAYVADASCGTEYFETMTQNILILAKVLRHLVLEAGTTEEEYQKIIQQAQEEIADEGYSCLAYMYSVSGQK